MDFTWDPAKARKVAADHNIDFSKVQDVFVDPFAIEFIDAEHSDDDDLRFAIIGLSAEYGLVYVVFTEHDHGIIRLITARRAERWMVRDYEEARRRL